MARLFVSSQSVVSRTSAGGAPPSPPPRHMLSSAPAALPTPVVALGAYLCASCAPGCIVLCCIVLRGLRLMRCTTC